jgi:uncharacterized repeat protein (TIGR03803 family)
MTSQRTLKTTTQILGTRVLFLVVLIVLIAHVAQAQQAAAGRPSRQPSGAGTGRLEANGGTPNRLTILYSFTGGADGGGPGSGGLVYLNGNLYGTTMYDGDGNGLVFELSNPQNAGWIDTPIFTICPDGGASCNPYGAAGPAGGLTADHLGNLYGATFLGNGGTLFELTPSAGVWIPRWITNIDSTPLAAVVFDQEGNLYGTLASGGVSSSPYCVEPPPDGAGSVYELSATQGYLQLYGFCVFDGAGPASPLTLNGPTIYGSTPSGGHGGGLVFELQESHQVWNEAIRYYFCSMQNCADGENPSGNLILDEAGNLYGTTLYGGANGKGTVFKLSHSKQTWSETVLYSFCSLANCADGSYPQAGLVLDKTGNLYGTTCNSSFGVLNLPPNFPTSGTVFQLTPEGVLNEFAELPGCSLAPLILVDNTLYGTTSTGGPYNAGAVFSVSMQPLTTTELASSVSPSIYGQPVSWTATVTPTGSVPPTGNVNFTWAGNSIGTAALNASGVATLTRSNLNADSYPLTAVYKGDANNAPSTSAILNQVVTQTTSSATISASPNPSNPGQPVTFTARITSPTATPTGPVTFTAGNSVLATVELSGGKATFTTSALPAGSTTVTVTYPWNSDISASSASVIQTVQESGTQEQSHTALTTSESPSLVGQPVTFTATVTSKSGTIPNGELVTFKIGNTVIGTGTTAGGIAAFTTSSLKASEYDVAATYAGDAVFASSTGTVHQTVQLAPTATSLSSSPNPSTNGQTVTFTAQVTTIGPSVPTGVIVFQGTSRDGRTEPLIAGVATLTMPLFSTSSVTANYVGDGSNAKSVSPAVDQVVGPLFPTTTTLTSSLNPSTYQQTVFLTATVTSGASVPPSGTVRFRGAGGVDVNAILTNGVAVLGSAKMDPGDHTLTAHYVAQSPWGESESQPVLQIVNRAPTTTTLVSSPNPALFGQPVTITASVAPPAGDSGPTAGEVTFFAGGKQIGERPVSNPVIQATTLPAGSTTITASYNGTELFSGSVGTLAQTVNPLSTTTTVTSSKNPSRQGENVTFVATVTATSRYVPQGTVTFTAGAATLGTVGLNGTAARLTNSTLPVGSTTVTATYSGNADFTGSSGMMTQTVGP